MPLAAITTSLKRPGDDVSDVDDATRTSTTPVHKLQRVDSSSGLGTADFSNAVKKKSAGGSSSRTGQACDRCKVNIPICYAIPYHTIPYRTVPYRTTPYRLHAPVVPSSRTMRTCVRIIMLMLCPDPQDTMRRTTRRLLAVPPEQHRV